MIIDNKLMIIVDNHAFNTKAEVENYKELKQLLSDEITNETVVYDDMGFATYYGKPTDAHISVSPSLLVTILSPIYPINMKELPDDFELGETANDIQKASYQATNVQDAWFQFNCLTLRPMDYIDC